MKVSRTAQWYFGVVLIAALLIALQAWSVFETGQISWINFVLRKKKLVPFGLFLAIGAGVYTFAGPELIAWYFSFFNL